MTTRNGLTARLERNALRDLEDARSNLARWRGYRRFAAGLMVLGVLGFVLTVVCAIVIQQPHVAWLVIPAIAVFIWGAVYSYFLHDADGEDRAIHNLRQAERRYEDLIMEAQ